MSEQLLRIKCPNLACQRILSVPEAARGKLVRCKQCGSTISIPEKKIEQPGSAPPPVTS